MTSHRLNPLSANLTVGLDLGDTTSRVYAVDAAGTRVAEATIATSRPGMRRYFSQATGWCVVLEVGTHSPWVSRDLAALGHHVVAGNSSATYGAKRRRKRNDRMDAEFLARQGRADPQLLHPIQHRSLEAQQHLELLRARDQLVQARSKLVNHVRGVVKSFGSRISKCSAEAFPKRAASDVPEVLRPEITPLLEVLTDLTTRIAGYDRQIAAHITAHYPVAARLQQPAGLGGRPPDCGGLRPPRRGSVQLPEESGRRRVLWAGAAAGRE